MPWYISGIISFVHVACAVIAVGGSFFLRIMLMRIAKKEGGLTPELQAMLGARWVKVMWHSLFGLLLTGAITLGNSFAAGHYGPLQQALLGVKFLLIFAIVGILSVLSANPPSMKEKRGQLLLINIALGFLVVLVSTLLRRSY